ncbi:MAG: zinc ribbon domain-containing protein [Candidatus Aminicenantes bacterium]
MTTSNNKGWNIAIVILVVFMLILAFRSIFWVLPFGVFTGMNKAFRGGGHGFAGIGDLGPMGFSLALLPIALIALWALVLIWVYKDAERRGMSGILWLLLVLIGNIVGLLIYAIVRSERPVKLEAGGGGAGPGAPSGKCPGCGNPVATGHAFCPYCGKKLSQTGTCPACGKPVQGEWKVCPACGTGLDPGQPRQA